MSSTHQPATPLPWRAQNWNCHAPTTVLVDDASHATGKQVIAETAGFGRMSESAAVDAAYLTHAANAYPRLVAALKLLRARLSVPATPEGHGDDVEALAITTKLLADLGEAP